MSIPKSFYAVFALGAATLATANAADELQAFTTPRPRVTVLHGTESVLGKPLIGAAGEKAGRIVDVVADPNGQVRAAIIDFGGFLGIGSRKIAVTWTDLRFEGPEIKVDLTRERLSRAPEVQEGRPVLAISARSPRDRADASGQARSP